MADVNSLSLIVNVQDSGKTGLLDSFSSNFPSVVPTLVRNDTIATTVRFVKPSAISGQPWEDIDYSAAAVTMALGEFDKTPQSGSFTLTYGANTTAAIAYNVSAATLQTTLNALASVTSAGGVTVTSPNAGIFVVTFVSVGARTTMASVSTLFPDSHVVVSKVVTGTASVAEVQVIQLIVDPYALNSTWSSFSGAGATISTLAAGDGTSPNVQSVTLSPVPYAGTFQLTTTAGTTAAIPYNASAQTVQDALGGSTLYTVTGDAGGPWTVTAVTNGSGTAFTASTTGLKVPVGLSGSLALSTYGMFNRFLTETADTITLKLEIQITPVGGGAGTVLQIPVSVSRDVINYSSLVPTPIASYYTAAQVDALFVAIAGTQTITGAKTFSTKPTVPGVQLDIAAAPADAVGLVRWNSTDKCAEFVTDGGVVIQMGQEETVYVRNMSGVAMANGDVVYITGATGYRTTVGKATANSSVAAKTIGMVTTSAGIADNAYGFVTINGLVRDLNTNGLTEGAAVYLSPTTAGAFTTTHPTADAQRVVRVGYVVRAHVNQGVILVDTHYMGTPVFEALAESEGTTAAQATLGVPAAINATLQAKALSFDGTAGATIGNGGIAAVGTGDFTFGCFVVLSAIGSVQRIVYGASGAFGLSINASGYPVSSLVGTGDNTAGTTALVAGQITLLAYKRSGTTGTYYINGVSAGTTTDSRNYSVVSTTLTDSTGYLTGSIARAAFLNFALSDAEVLDLYSNRLGAMKPEWAGGSMVALNTGSLVTVEAPASGFASTSSTSAIRNSSSDSYWSGYALGRTAKKGQRFLVSLTVSNLTNSSGELKLGSGIGDPGDSDAVAITSNGFKQIVLTSTTNAAAYLNIRRCYFDFTGLSIIPLGALFAQDDADRSAGYQSLDISGNAKHLTLPASGVTRSMPAQLGTARATLTWAASSTAQSLLGQVALPANAVVTRITCKPTASTSGTGIKINSVTTTSYWVAATALTANVKKVLTLAQQLPASTSTNDCTITVTPDSVNYTGSIEVSVDYMLSDSSV